jgi:hypothetical protein
MNEDHELGRCGACHEDTEVRWKNLYTIGSEGTWLCMPCEMVVVQLINSMSHCAIKKKKQQIMDAKRTLYKKEI